MTKRLHALLLGLFASISCVGAADHPAADPRPSLQQIEAALAARFAALKPNTKAQILAIDPEHVTARQVREVLSNAPAPRIILIHGGLLPVQQLVMKSFARFIIGLGYPEWSVRNPADGSYSCSSFCSSSKLAGLVAGYYEMDGLRPMMVGHSLGGMQVVKVLQTLSGELCEHPVVWNPVTQLPQARDTIRDPLTCESRPITNLQVCYACALASGGLGRLSPNEWDMIFRLRRIPRTVEEFTGFCIGLDPLGGDFLGFGPSNLYAAEDTARVRNVRLPTGANHWTVPITEGLLPDSASLDWINNYSPNQVSAANPVFNSNARLIWAADVWNSIKRHWVQELQRYIRAQNPAK